MRFRVLILLTLLLCRNFRGCLQKALSFMNSLGDRRFSGLVKAGVDGAVFAKILKLSLDAGIAGVGSLGTTIALHLAFDR
jgi:hypothetical protein